MLMQRLSACLTLSTSWLCQWLAKLCMLLRSKLELGASPGVPLKTTSGLITAGPKLISLPNQSPMNHKFCIRLMTGLYLMCLSAVLVAAEPQDTKPEAAAEVDFNRDIAHLLSKNCVACHNAKKSEGGLNLETHTSLMAGGDTGV